MHSQIYEKPASKEALNQKGYMQTALNTIQMGFCVFSIRKPYVAVIQCRGNYLH